MQAVRDKRGQTGDEGYGKTPGSCSGAWHCHFVNCTGNMKQCSVSPHRRRGAAPLDDITWRGWVDLLLGKNLLVVEFRKSKIPGHCVKDWHAPSHYGSKRIEPSCGAITRSSAEPARCVETASRIIQFFCFLSAPVSSCAPDQTPYALNAMGAASHVCNSLQHVGKARGHVRAGKVSTWAVAAAAACAPTLRSTHQRLAQAEVLHAKAPGPPARSRQRACGVQKAAPDVGFRRSSAAIKQGSRCSKARMPMAP